MLGLGSLSLIYQMFIVLFIFGIWFVLMEKSYYFNLIWLLKYRYYKVQDEIGNTYIIYSKRNDVKEVGEIQNLVRINNFTFWRRSNMFLVKVDQKYRKLDNSDDISELVAPMIEPDNIIKFDPEAQLEHEDWFYIEIDDIHMPMVKEYGDKF